MKLLIDIGNSRLKWGTEQDGDLQYCAAIDYRRDDFLGFVNQQWKDLSLPKQVAISSVGSIQIVDQLRILIMQLWPNTDIVIAVSSAYACGVSNIYKKPTQLGVDRWLSLLALHRYYRSSACVIDCGTAITIDFIDDTGRHQGGLITPGLTLMKKALMEGTIELPMIEKDQNVGLADHTAAAIYSGTLYSVVGLVEHALARHGGRTQTVVVTGGDARLIAENLEAQVIVEPNLVLKGLSVYCDEGEPL